jgi:hypothetical protein
MRSRTAGVWCASFVAAALIASCGGGSGKGAGHPAPTATPTFADNGVATLPPEAIYRHALRALRAAPSVHFAVNLINHGQHIALDVFLAHDRAKGSLLFHGIRVHFVRVGQVTDLLPSDALWRKIGGTQAVHLLHGKWLKGDKADPQLHGLLQLTKDPASFLDDKSVITRLRRFPGRVINGQPTVALGPRGGHDDGRMYISRTGPPYPVLLLATSSGGHGRFTFDHYGESVTVVLPKSADVIDPKAFKHH